ncbi:MAG: ADP-heptose--LPS heptosyltransferase 2 [Chlamydiota bacterium]|jgi:heptosyltransferase-2
MGALPLTPNNIVVRMPNWVGDLVMATPVLIDLRRAFPSARITAMAQTSVADLLADDASINELFRFTRPQSKFQRRQEKRNIIAKLEEGQYDVGVLLTRSFSSAWWFWQAGIPRRIGFKGNFRSLLLTDRLPLPVGMHQVEVFKQLLRPLGIEGSKTAPKLSLSGSQQALARDLLAQNGHVPGERIVGINPGASYGSAKCWPNERFRELAKRLAEQENWTIVFFGDPSMTGQVKAICRGLPKRVIDLAGKTDLRQLMCLIADCDVFVTNDSGPMHIADALGVEVVALFGSTDPAATGPYRQPLSVVYKKVSCSPCFRRDCPIDFRCMTSIGVDEVLQRVERVLQQKRRV